MLWAAKATGRNAKRFSDFMERKVPKRWFVTTAMTNGQIGNNKGDDGEMANETVVSIELKMGDDVSNVCFQAR